MYSKLKEMFNVTKENESVIDRLIQNGGEIVSSTRSLFNIGPAGKFIEYDYGDISRASGYVTITFDRDKALEYLNAEIKPVMFENKSYTAVSSSDFESFIEINSNLDYDEIHDLVYEYILDDCYSRTYNSKIKINIDNGNKLEFEWINKFFDAHPFIERILIVRDNN